MNVQDFLPRIQAAGFTLETDGADVIVRPFSRLNDTQRQFIRQHKPAIIAALTGKAITTRPEPADPDHGTDTDQETLARAIAILDAGHRLSVESGRLVGIAKEPANRDEPQQSGINRDQSGPVARLWNCTTPDGRHFEAYFSERIPEAEARRRIGPDVLDLEPVFPTPTQSDAQNGAIQPEPLAQHHLDQDQAATGIHGPGIPLVVCGTCQHFVRDQIGDGTGIGSCPTVNPPGLLWPGTERHCAKFAPIIASTSEARP